jgi:catechol 2,3-dioxygenase-like lactoylglutathione lyase family enzyme
MDPIEVGSNTFERWAALVPELVVGDLERSLSFYGALGFRVRFRRDEPPFAYLELGAAELMLEQQHASGWNILPLDRPLGRGLNLQIEVQDLDRVYHGVVALGWPVLRNPAAAWYATSDEVEEGQVEFLIQDPDGFLLRFIEVMGPRTRTRPAAPSAPRSGSGGPAAR